MNTKRILIVAALTCLTVALVGCGSDSDSKSSSSTTTSKQAVCADKDKLEQSVRSLTASGTITDKSSIEAALKKVEKNLDALRSSAKADLEPAIDDMKSALDELQTVVSNFDSGSITDNLKDAGTAVSKVGSSASALATALDTSCP